MSADQPTPANQSTGRLPPHPMVIDKITLLARPATQEDIDRMDAICSAYAEIVEKARQVVVQSSYLKDRLENVYGR